MVLIMKPCIREIEVQCNIHHVFSTLLRYPHFNVNHAEKIAFKERNIWVEVSNGEVQRRMEMITDDKTKAIILLCYNSTTISHFDEKIIFSLYEKEKECTMIHMQCEPGETFSSKLGFHMRKQSIEIWMEKILEIIKSKVYSR